MPTSNESDRGSGSRIADDDAQYEFKSLKTIRGTEARTTAKWQNAGWELDTQSQGPLRTEMTFRRVKPKTLGAYLRGFVAQSWEAFNRQESKTQRLLLAGLGGLILVMVGIGIAAGNQGGDAPVPTAAATAPSTAAAAVPSEAPSEKPSQKPEATATTKPEAVEILTVGNNKDLAALLRSEDYNVSGLFAAKYQGRTIKFDGYIAVMNNHGDNKTRYDFLVQAGNYSETSQTGPSFQFRDVNIFDLNLTGSSVPDSVGKGDNLHVIARVGKFNPDTGLFLLEPVSTEVR